MNAGTQIFLSAVIGGTAEKIGDGKFANGAVTGAYVGLFNHAMHDGNSQLKETEGPWELSPEEGGYVKNKKTGLAIIEEIANWENVELSMYELEDGRFFINPWGNNLFNKSSDLFSVGSDGIYHDGSRIINQYHYGPTGLGYLSIPGTEDMLYAHRNNVTVYHINNKYVYQFRSQELWYWIDPPARFMAKKQFYNK